MKIPVKLTNIKTNVIFLDPNPHLLAYAKNNSDFVIEYEDDGNEPDTTKEYTPDTLKAMSMKDLQVLADSLSVECDKRRKDSLIDGILKAGR